MAEDKIEEETYSLILSALKHPLRRKILRMLSDKPLSFSEILESVSIDSGHLNYHIKSMGDIVTRTDDGKYALSSVGYAAIELVGKVEEQGKSNRTDKRAKRISKLALVFSAIFAVALLTASVYALTFTTQDQVAIFGADPDLMQMVPVRIEPHQTFDYNVTFIQVDYGSDRAYSIDVGQQQTLVRTPLARNDLCEWREYFSYSVFELNHTSFSLKVQGQDGVVLGKRAWINGTISTWFPIGSVYSPKFGNYSLQIENYGDEEVNATLVPSGGYMFYQRPLFDYGIIGLVLLIIYPVLLILSWNWNKKLQSKRTGSNPPSFSSPNKLAPY